MQRKDDIALAREAMLKKARGAIRTHYSTLADRRLNEVLPELDRLFQQNIQRGILPDPEVLLIEAGFEGEK